MSAEHINKVFIQALEQRIMLDGAAASSILDVVESENVINLNEVLKQNEKENLEPQLVSQDPAVSPLERSGTETEKRNIVFIDSQVTDYDQIINTFKEGTEVHIIDANENGFEKMASILQDQNNVDGIHIIGHGSAGQILFGNAFLNNDTITDYQTTLASIGQSLTTSGDILFYGCNVASTDQGELLIKKISEITKADIAASDDITGKGGDWVLENKFGIVETKNVQLLDYNHSLGSLSTVSSPSGTGITHKDNNVTIMDHTTNNLNVGLGSVGAYSTVGADFGIVLERENVSISSGDHISDVDVDTSYTLDDPGDIANAEIQGGADQTASEDMIVNSYLMMHVNGADQNALNDAGEVVFDGEIVGVLFDQAHTRAQTVDGNTFHSTSFIYNFTDNGGSSNAIDTDGARIIEGRGGNQNFFNSYKTSIPNALKNADMEWVSVGNHGSGTNNVLQFGSENAALKAGDYIRILVKQLNSAPAAVNDTDSITEGLTLTVESGENHVLNDDTDADSDSLTVTFIGTGSNSDQAVAASSSYNSNGTAITGTYGTLTIGADGTYTYAATESAANAISAGSSETDTFTYTISDGNGGTDTATLIITINGANDAPTATADTGYIQEGKTLTVADGASANDADSSTNNNDATGDHTGDILGNDTDPDTNDTLTVTTYSHTSSTGQGGAASGANGNSGTAGTNNVVGAYGTLDLEANGSYTYTANSDITNLDVDDETFTDVFTYTLSDGTTTTTATITITIEASGDVTAQNDTGSVNEDGTLTVSNDGDATSVAAASYSDSDSFTIAGSDSSPATTQNRFEDMIFNDDGTKMYVLGYESGVAGKNIFQYTLSTPFDVSTASVSSDDYITVGGSTENNEAIRFNNDGTKLFVLNDATSSGSSIMYQYTLSTPYDITSTVTAGNTFTLGNNSDNFRSFLFNDDGSKMFVSKGYRYIYEYTLSTLFDTSTATLTDTSFYVTNPSYGLSNYGSSYHISGMQYNSDGTKLFTVHQNNTANNTAKIVEWSLSTAYDPTTASTNADFNDTSTYFETGETTTASASPTHFITFNNDGSKFFSFNGAFSGLQKIKEWNVSSPFSMLSTSGSHSGDTIDTSSASNSDSDADGDTLTITAIRTGSSEGSGTDGTVGAALTGTYGQLTIASDGSYTYVANQAAADALDPGDTVTDAFNYTVSDGNGEDDIAVLTITVVGINDDPVAQNDTGTVNEDGTLTVSNSGNATSVTAATHDSSPLDISSQDGSPVGMRFNNDGTKVFMVGENGGDINEYALSTAFDISTASYTQNFDLTSQDTEPRDVTFNSDGTKMFIIGNDGDTIELHEYALSTAYSLSSVSHTTSNTLTSKLPGGSQDTEAFGIDFNTAGTKFFISGRQNNNIYEFTVSSGFDLTSTVAYDSAFDISSEAAKAQNIRFNNDGTKLFVVDNDGNDVNEYTLTTGFDISTASHSGSFSVTSQDGTPVGLAFNNDGTKMFVAGWDGDDINEYALTSPFSLVDVSGENTGDVLDTSSSSNEDTDADTDASLTVTAIRTGSSEGSGTAGTVGSALTGTYGQLTIAADGSYSYVANQSAADALDPGDVVTDAFNYTVSDGSGTDIAVLTITVLGINDTPVADNETNSVTISTTTTVNDGTSDVLYGDTDVDGSASLSVSSIVATTAGGSAQAVAASSTNSSNFTTATGSFGTLRIGADGTYVYIAGSSNGTDVFTYTLSDGTATDTATLTFTVTGSNAAPSATADTGYIAEDSSFSVSDGAAAEDGTDSNTNNESGDHTGDVLGNDSDSDGDSLTITSITATTAGGSAQTTFTSNTETVTGAYGTLTINSNGSYSYAATADAADALDAGDTITDVFTYIVSDGTDTDTSTLTITIAGINDAPVAQDDVGVIVEGGTLTVANSANANVSGSYDATGEHSGDVIDTSSASHTDSDADASASLTITEIRTGATENAGTSGTVGAALTGTYGQLTIASDGSYSYVANQAAADALDDTESAVDSFNYTLSDGTDTDFGVIRITVLGSNDAPTAVNDTDTATEGSVTTVTGSEDDVLNDDSDVDVETITVTNISHTNGNDESVTASTTYSNGQSIAGTYGTLVIGADGSYEFTPNDVLGASETGNDVFTYTVSDGTATSTATLTITTTGANDTPVAQNDTGTVNENATLSVSNGDNANSITTAATTYSSSDAVSISAQEGNGAGLAFSQDGLKMFHAGNDDDDIHEYTLTTAFDVSTASYVDSLDVSARDINIFGITFNNDGTKLYFTGAYSSDAIFQYTLSTAYDISTGTYDNVSLSVNDTRPSGIRFNNDGTKLFVTGHHTNKIEEYSLSTAFNLATASYASSDRLDITAYETNARDIEFNSDGTRLFVLGDAGDDITEYTLSTAFDVSTATYRGEYDISSQDTKPFSLRFNNDGSKMFILGSNSDKVHEYSLVSPYNLIDVHDEHSGDVLDTSSSSNSDSDADTSDTLTVSAIRTGGTEGAGTAGSVGSALTGTYGQLTINANGSYSYVANTAAAEALDAGDVVTDQFNYTVSDGTATDTAVITITVIGINDAPVAVNDTDSVNENATVTQSSGSSLLAADDADVDASSATLTITQIAKTGGSNSTVSSGTTYSNGRSITGTYGTLVVGADGSYTYTADQSAADDLDLNDTATDSFTYTVSDGTNTDTATLIFTVTGVNDAPVADNETGAVTEDATLTVTDGTSDVLYGDTDADDSASLTVTTYSHTSATDEDGASASTGNGNSGTAGTDSVVGYYGTLTLAADGTYTYTADQSVADALDADDTVTDVFTYTVSDGSATDTATITFTITGANDTPVATDDTGAVNEDATLTVSSAASGVVQDNDTDPDTDDTAASLEVSQIAVSGGSNSAVNSGSTYNSGTPTTVTGTYGQLTIGADGTYTYVANQSAADDLDAGDTATDTFTYTVTDTTGATSTADITITVTGVNDVPTASDNTVTTTEDTPYVFSTSDFGYADADDDDSLVSVKITTLEDDGALQYYDGSSWQDVTLNQVITATDISNGYLRLNPDTNDTGSPYTTFEFSVNDGDADSTSSYTMTINVTIANDAPTAVADTDVVDEDGTVIHSTNGADTLVSDDTDPESDSLTVTNIAVTGGSNSAVASGSTYNSGSPTSVTGTYGTLTVGANGTYTYTADQSAADDLDAGDPGTDSFTYTVSDGNGGTDTATLIFTVTGINDVPTASDNTVSTTEDTPYVFSTDDFGYTDADDDDTLVSVQITTLEDDGALQYYDGSAWQDVTLNQVITATDISNGYLRLNPDANDNGSPYTTFAFTVNDGDADSATPNTMTVNVTAANDDPVADDETNTATEGTTTTVTDGASDVLAGDTDPESDTLTVSGIRTGTEAAGTGTSGSVGSSLTGTYGALTIESDGTYTYTPNDSLGATETGTDYFTYTVSDGNGGDDTGQIAITVTGINDDPVANTDTGTVSLDNSSTTTGNLITNDTDADDSATLTVTACGQGQSVGSRVKTVGESFNHSRNWGNMTINSNGSYSFVAVPGIEDLLDPGESVTIYFWYTVSDGTSTSSSTIAITIERGNDAKPLNKPQFKDVRKQIKELPPAEPVADLTKTVAEVRANKLQLETVVNNAELPKTEKVLQVNEGLKLVDLVAETGSFSISSNTPESTQSLKTQEGQSSDLVNLENLLQTNDKNNLKVRVNPDDALKLKFGVFNESSNEVVRYEGKMPDGSKLPDWIKVNPRNGKVTTVVPKGVDNVEFVVVATDTNNDQREIKVKIDPQQLAKDKTLFKRAEKIAKKVPDQSTSIIVNESGQANLIQQDKVTKQIDKVATNILNSNSSDISINDLNISDIISSIDSVEKLNQTQMMKSGKVEFTITKEFLGNFNDIKIVLSDGKDLPAWAKFDPETGTMIILPPDGQKELKLKMIINNNGEITVKDLEIKIVKVTDPNNKNAELPDQHFTSFKDQIAMQNADWDDYGDNLIKRI